MSQSPLLAIAGLSAIGAFCQWFAWRVRLPSILFLLFAGILVGPVLGVFDPDDFLGDLLFPFVSVAVAIILFEGGLTLKYKDIQGHGAVVRRLISVGVVITWVLMSWAAHILFQIPWAVSLVFGSIVVVSGPTVVKPLLRSVRPSDRVGHVLHWEGILIDPIGVFLALLVFDYVLLDAPGQSWPYLLLILGKLIVVGTALGLAAGWAMAHVLRNYLVPDYLVNIFTLAAVITTFAFAELLQHESGLLAVTLMGVWLANSKGLSVKDILHFKEDLAVLLISTLFIVLAARLELAIFPQYWWQILVLLAVSQFIVRPLNAFVCSLGSSLDVGERIFLGWVAPRGIVAAAVSSLFAIRLAEAGVEGSELLAPLVFSMIIGTVVFQSLTAKPLADRLGISNPEPNGVLFFGAGPLARQLGEALKDAGIRVLLSDTSFGEVRQARQQGLDAYHGNPTSGHAAENLDLEGIGKLIALTDNREANALAGVHFYQEFGSDSVFSIDSAGGDDAYNRFDSTQRSRANTLFDPNITYAGLRRRMQNGTIRRIVIGEAVDENQTVDEQALAEELDMALKDATQETSSSSVNETSQERGGDGVVREDSAEREDNKNSSAENEVKPADSSVPANRAIAEDELALFAIDNDGVLHIYSDRRSETLKAGWQLIVLQPNSTTNE